MPEFDYEEISNSLIGELEQGVERSLRHNLAILRAVHWGAREVCSSDIEFDPRADWWAMPERRFLVAFLANTWPRWPADESIHPALEELCVALGRAVDGLRARGEITWHGFGYEGPELGDTLVPIRALAAGLEDHGWSRCRPRRHDGESLEQALLKFLDRVIADFGGAERSLQPLMRWWAVLGAGTVDELRQRQRFFWHYRVLLCTNNAYVHAGAQYFGPVIGNTAVGLLRGTIGRWRGGESLEQAPLMALDRHTDTPSDRSHTNIARELWGFLNLHRHGPFYNARAADYRRESEDPMAATGRIGVEIRDWLAANPKREAALAQAFERWLPRARRSGGQPLAEARRYRRKTDSEGVVRDEGSSFDVELNAQLHRQGGEHLLALYGPRERAAVMMHLGLDAQVYMRSAGRELTTYDPPAEAGGLAAGEGLGPGASPLVGLGVHPAERLRAAGSVWFYAPGGNANRFDSDVAEGVARIYWGDLGDLGAYGSSKDLFERLVALRGTGAASPVNDKNTIWAFARRVERGDVVIARKGLRTIIGLGLVTRTYTYAGDESGDDHQLGIDWFWTGSFTLRSGRGMPMRTFVRGTQRAVLLGKLERHLRGLDEEGEAEEEEPDAEAAKSFDLARAVEDLFFDEADVDKWRRLLERRRNIVLTGPPGVGKTFVAKRLARLVTGMDSDAGITIVQFHQAYTYEQFVLGYRPTGARSKSARAKGGAGQTSGAPFELGKGPLFRLAEEALSDPDARFVLIIDEINRGNISRILGEALMLLEADKRSPRWGLKLAYELGDSEFPEGRFYLPENLYVIGTMNTADRSLAVVDYALRRRFAFVGVGPRLGSKAFGAHAKQNDMPDSVLERLRERVGELNERVAADRALGRGFLIGHSFFSAGAGEEGPPWRAEADEEAGSDPEAFAHRWLDEVFEYELEPLLREYWAEDPAQLEAAIKALWKGRARP